MYGGNGGFVTESDVGQAQLLVDEGFHMFFLSLLFYHQSAYISPVCKVVLLCCCSYFSSAFFGICFHGDTILSFSGRFPTYIPSGIAVDFSPSFLCTELW